MYEKKSIFVKNDYNSQTQESTVNCISRGDLSLYQLIKTIIATEGELISILLHNNTNLSYWFLKQSQTIFRILSLMFQCMLVSTVEM